MRGSIIKRSKNSYRIAVSLGKGPDGKYKQHFETVRGNKKDAERRLRELLSTLDNGTFVNPGKLTVADYLEQWLKDYAYPNLSPRTAEGYAGIIKGHLIPAFGKLHLAELRPDMIQRYYSDKLATGRYDSNGGLSAQTVQHHHMCLHGALKNAVRWVC